MVEESSGKRLHELTVQLCKELGTADAANIVRKELIYVENAANNTVTLEGMFDTWLENFTYNQQIFRKSFGEQDIRKCLKLEDVIVVGAGPSVTDKQLKKLKKWNGAIVCTNKMFPRLLDLDIMPTLCVVVDGNKSVAEPLERLWGMDYEDVSTYFMVATQVDPRVAVILSNFVYVYWFNSLIPEEFMPNAEYILRKLSGLPTIDTGGNAGLFAAVMAKTLGAKRIALLGMEHCHKLNPLWKNDEAEKYQIIYAPEDGMSFAVTPAFVNYLNNLISYIAQNQDVKWTNLTKFGLMYTRRKTLEPYIKYADLEEYI